MQSPRWIVSQIGARQHYGVPRGFDYYGDLRVLYTDSWCRWGSSLLRRAASGRLRAFAGRFHPDLSSERVVARSLWTEWNRWRRGGRGWSTEAVYGEYLRSGAAFGRWVTRDLARRALDPGRDVFFGFNTGCLETLEWLRGRGVFTMVDQIDPGRVEEDLVLAEAQRWPGWQEMPGRIPEAYFERLAAEWSAASLVVVNSEWSRAALMAQGVPTAKLLIVPVAYETTVAPPRDPRPGPDGSPTGPLTVLWLGTVNLRKGIPYLVEAARLLQRTDIRFVVAGPVEISRAAVDAAPPNVSFLGRVTRDQTAAQYRAADVFVLPTISDGFAITQVEAMAQGLPVITTRHCGEVVTNGLDGVLVPARDARALAEAIARLDADRELLREMSEHARRRANTFQLPRQAAQIEAAVRHHRGASETVTVPAVTGVRVGVVAEEK